MLLTKRARIKNPLMLNNSAAGKAGSRGPFAADPL